MIEIVIDDKIIEVPSELTIEQYQNLKRYKHIYEKDKTKLLAMYLNVSSSELKDLPAQQVEFVEKYISSNLLEEDYKDETYECFNFDGVEYGLENDWSKLTWGAWVDLEVFSSDNLEENIHKIMAVLYRPIVSKKKKKYTIEKYKSDEIEDRAETFKKLPLKYWFGAASFFFLLVSISINNTVNSLSLKNKLNRLMVMGWMKLPKWIKRKLPLDSILF